MSISIQFSSIWPFDKTLSLGQSGPESHGNKGVLQIPQSSSITGASSSDCSVSYPGHSLGESDFSAEMQSVYIQCIFCSPTPNIGDTGNSLGCLTPLLRCSRCILQPHLTGPLNSRWGYLTPLQRCCWCILLPTPQPTRPQDTCWESIVFVATSHQTGLDTRSKAWRSIKVGIKGRGRSGTSQDLTPAGQCCSSTH